MGERIKTLPEFEGLTFESDTHTYRLNSQIIPSVSAIMAPLSTERYKGINEATLNEAANKGTAVHNSIENWLEFGIDDIPPEHEGYFNGFRQWKAENLVYPVGTEVRAYHKLLRYGGTIDLLCYIGDELNLIDYKTTYAVSDMLCGVQLEAYSQILLSHGIKVDRKKILHLKKDGTFKVIEYPVADAERWRVFGSLKCVYDYIHK